MRKLVRLLLVLLVIAFPTSAWAISGTACPGTGCITINVAGQGTFGLQITNTFVGTIGFSKSINGTDFVDLSLYPNGSSVAVTNTTTTGYWSGSVGDATRVRIAFTAYMSGTANVFSAASAVKFNSPGGGGSGTPAGLNTQLQFNNNGAFGGITHATTDGDNLIVNASAPYVYQWRPTNYLTQNGAWTCRTQMQTNPNDAMRRDDTVACGWNVLGERAATNSSQLVFESYYKTNAGARQSETYFTVGDGMGNGHRPFAVYFDIDGNVDTQIHQASSWQVCDITDCSQGFLSATLNHFGSDFSDFSLGDINGVNGLIIAANDVQSGAMNIPLELRPQGTGRIHLGTSVIGVDTPLYADHTRNLTGGTFHGATRDFATVTGSTPNGHIASWDASGNLVDGGAGGSGCTVPNISGAIVQSDGAGGCTASANAKLVNPQTILLNQDSGISQFIADTGGAEGVRVQSPSDANQSNGRVTFADGQGGSIDVAIGRIGVAAMEVNTGTEGVVTGTTLNVGVYKAGGTTGVTASGSSCTITAIKGGIITGATCAP